MHVRFALTGLLTALVLFWAAPVTLAYTDPDFKGVIGELGDAFIALDQGDPAAVIVYMTDIAVPLINIVCILMIMISGISMTFSQSDSQATTARNTILVCLGAIAAVYTAKTVSLAVFRPDGTSVIQDPSGTASALATEIYGIISYAETPLAVIAVLMIVISGLRAVLSFGSDDSIAQIRRTIFAILAGIALIIFKLSIATSITITGRPEDGFLAAIMTVLVYILSFVGLAAVVMIVIAGILMIVNIGNDDQYQKARTLILRVAIGLIVILACVAIANVIYFGTLGGPLF